ncbi:MAG: FCD domain-containing protein [Solirubrobacterales bacterium]
MFDEDNLERLEIAARDRVDSAGDGNVLAELGANRRFHFAIFDSPDQPHTLRLIRQLRDSTEPYRAMYYNAPDARRESLHAHDRILAAIRIGDPDNLIAELDAHRRQTLAHFMVSLPRQ